MKNCIVNSTLALTSAFLMTVILHEVAHYFMAFILGCKPTLFHNRVEYATNGFVNNDLLIAGAGPLFSLIQGLIAYHFAKKIKIGAGALFVLWFGLAGLITFFGYLMIAPMVPMGDTGKVFYILKVPILVQIAIALFAIVGITIILIKSTTLFERYVIEDSMKIKETRKKWAIAMILTPLLLSIILITILQFPIPHIASILATTCGPFSIMAIFGTFLGSKNKINSDFKVNSINDGLSISLILIFVSIFLLNRFLVSGI